MPVDTWQTAVRTVNSGTTNSGTTTSKLQQSDLPSQEFKPRSIEERSDLGPLNLEQELELFCNWKSDAIWVPPKDTSTELARTMLDKCGPFASKEECWKVVEKVHRSSFTHVREIELPKSSIRLPQGRIFVSVTQQKDFDEIEEPIPGCVQTRLQEFVDGPRNKRGTKIYYLKPLCVEVDSELVFTSKEEIEAATQQIQEEVFAEYRRLYLRDRLKKTSVALVNGALALPRWLIKSTFDRKKREIERYHRKMEFQRKKLTMKAVKFRKKFRTDRCTYDDLLALTHTPSRERVIQQYCEQYQKSDLDRHMFLIMSAASLPWFVGLSIATVNLVTVSMAAAATVGMVDPVFVAEMPNKRGELLKIGHFDEVDGVMHVEI
jgi:hypothetical protein